MLFYLGLYAFVMALACIGEYVRPRFGIEAGAWRNRFWLLVFLLLFLVSALRFDVGTDYSSTEGYLGYVELFNLYSHGESMRYGIDPSFQGLIWLVSLFHGSTQWVFVITSALVCGLVVRACRRVSCCPALSLALFLVAGLYLESFNIIRQWIAIACVLNAFAWVGWTGEEGDAHPAGARSFVRYTLWILAASLAHPSALFWVLLWPLYCIRLNAKRALILVVLFACIAYVGWNGLAVVLEPTRYGRYFHDPSGLYNTPHLRPNAIVTTVCMLAFSIWAYWKRDHVEPDGRHSVISSGEPVARWWGRWASALTVCQCALLALLVSEAFLPYIVDRVARYLMPMLMLQIPWALHEVPSGRLRRGLAALACACWLAASTVQFVGGKDDVLPYRSILTTPQDEVEEMFYTSPVIPEADRPLTGE